MVELELLSDPDMLLMIESGVRGGIATISHRYVNATYMGAEFDHNKESKFISCLDVNGVYSWTMSKPLPTSGFEWMADDEIDDWKHLTCIPDVDLESLEDLHNLRYAYPFAPKRVKI